MFYQGEGQRVDIELRLLRLKDKKKILGLRAAKIFKHEFYSIKYTPSADSFLGIAPKKKVGNACVRNYVKRRLRHAFTIASTYIKQPHIFMIYPNPGLQETDFSLLISNFTEFIKETCS